MMVYLILEARSREREHYVAVAREVLHWCGLDRDAFEAAVSRQLALAAHCNELKSLRRIPRDFTISSDVQRVALASLIHGGHVKLPRESEAGWVNSILNPEEGIVPSELSSRVMEWSAEGNVRFFCLDRFVKGEMLLFISLPLEYDIRLPVLKNKMKTYRSRSGLDSNGSKAANDRFFEIYESILVEADRFRSSLLLQRDS